jgi:sortase A
MSSRAPRRRSTASAVAGVTGEVLITLGILLGLFLLWELWWTNFQATQAQAKEISSLGWAYDPKSASATPDPVQEFLTASTKSPHVDKQPALLTTFATIYIPRFGDSYARTITQGVDKATVLDVKGIGHYPGTAMPGGIGNFAIAGHRTTFGKPFNKIDKLKVGDPIIVQTKDGWYVYAVTSHLVTGWRNGEQVAPVPGDTTGAEKPTERMITLTSCHPIWQPIHRYIVHGELVYWAPPSGDKVPKELVTGTFSKGELDHLSS